MYRIICLPPKIDSAQKSTHLGHSPIVIFAIFLPKLQINFLQFFFIGQNCSQRFNSQAIWFFIDLFGTFILRTSLFQLCSESQPVPVTIENIPKKEEMWLTWISNINGIQWNMNTLKYAKEKKSYPLKQCELLILNVMMWVDVIQPFSNWV